MITLADIEEADHLWHLDLLRICDEADQADIDRGRVYRSLMAPYVNELLMPEIPPIPDLSDCRWIPEHCRKPTAQQAAFLALPHREVGFGGCGGGGKACYIHSMIPTIDGWKTMAELRIGDAVFDERGVTCHVIAKSDVMLDHDCYEVVFDDGERVTVDASHEWWTYTYSDRVNQAKRDPEVRARRRAARASRGNGSKPWLAERNAERAKGYSSAPVTGSIKTTKEIADTLTARHGTHKNHSVPVAGALEIPEVELPVPPYTLGVWLGDGNSGSGQITTPDEEVIKRIEVDGYAPVKLTAPYLWGIHGLRQQLRRAGVFENKHIPEIYLRASMDQRLELLRGLMDSDGCCDADGGAEFMVTVESLAKGVLELSRTLGIKSTFGEGRATLYGRDCGPKYRVKMTTNLAIFHLQRKGSRQKQAVRPTQTQRYIVECNPVESVPVQCITVDSPSHLYLVGRGFIPTHNSFASILDHLRFADVPGYSGLILRRTFADLSKDGAIMDQARQMLAGTAAKFDADQHRFTFPSGARLSFGHMQYENDKLAYQGGAWHNVTFDELEQFTPTQYKYLFSRQRRLKNMANIPLRTGSTFNPGGICHEFIKARFVTPWKSLLNGIPNLGTVVRPFVQALLTDNPYLDHESYQEGLAELDEVDRRQIEHGDWDVALSGDMFDEEMFQETYYRLPHQIVRMASFWDGATKTKEANDETANAVGVLGANGLIYIVSGLHGRYRPADAQDLIIKRYRRDAGLAAQLGCEYRCCGEDASSMTAIVDILPQFASDVCVELIPTLNKDLRWHASRVIKFFRAHRIVWPEPAPAWVADMRDQLIRFPNAAHDDMVKAVTGLVEVLMEEHLTSDKDRDAVEMEPVAPTWFGG